MSRFEQKEISMQSYFDAAKFGMANFVPLSPLSFLQRAASVYADKPATTYADTTRTWAEVAHRVRSVAAGLAARGVGVGDTVSVLSPNRPEVFELHFAVPLLGAVLNTINTRLDAETLVYILAHSDSRLVIVDASLLPVLGAAFKESGRDTDVIVLSRAGVHGADYADYEALILGVCWHGRCQRMRDRRWR